jgi:type I restriction enzyme, S subunit
LEQDQLNTDRSDPLPPGWSIQPIASVCAVNPKKPATDALKSSDPVTFVPMPAVDANVGAITAPLTRPFASVRKGFTAFANEDVIVAKITPCFENGKAAICRGLTNGLGFGSTEFHVLRCIEAVIPEYIYYFVRQESFRRGGEANMTGSVGQKRVPADWLKSVEIPLPPLAEQRRIVAKVEAVLARVNAARQRLAKLPALLKRFRQSTLAAACSGRLTDDVNGASGGEAPSGWRTATVADVCSTIVDCPHSTPKWTDAGEICLRTTNFRVGGLDLSETRYVSATTYAERISRLEPQPGDVLYSREGGILGIACAFPNNLRACLGQRMMLMRPGAAILSEYLAHVLNSPLILDVVRELTGGTASPHLNVGDVKAFAIPLPPLAEQHEIVRRVEALFGLTDKIEARVTAATARADKLIQATLAKAFRGNLVPTEAELAQHGRRDFETAHEFLERIHDEQNRAAASPMQNSSRRSASVPCKAELRIK